MFELLICDRIRPFLIYLILKKGRLDKTILITNEEFIPNGKFREKICYKVLKKRKIFKFLYYKIQEIKIRIKFSDLLKKTTDKVYGQKHIFGISFLDRKKMIVLEDGIKDYFIDLSIKNRIREIFYKVPPINSKKIEKYIFTGIEKIPNEILNFEKINLVDEWKKLKLEEKKNILKIFNVNTEELEELRSSTLLITQPLSEDCLISEKNKIKIYKKIIEENKDEKIFLKTHPREITDYKIFNNINILEKNFPLELLLFLEIHPKKVVTLYSTVALDFKKIGVPTVWYGDKLEVI